MITLFSVDTVILYVDILFLHVNKIYLICRGRHMPPKFELKFASFCSHILGYNYYSIYIHVWTQISFMEFNLEYN